MKHGITPEHWESYLEDSLAPDERDRIEAHLIGCLSCWEFHERLATLTARLREDGAAINRRFAVSDAQLQAGLRATYARICATNENNLYSPSVRQRLQELEAVMTLFCGSQAAANALQSAAKHSPAKRLPQVSPENWEAFLTRLTAIAHVLCGITGARLVSASGRL